MKLMSLLGFFLLTIVASGASQTYPLVCRGGDLRVIYKPALDRIEVLYRKGSQGSLHAAVPTGTCTWQDRGLVANEPSVLCIPIDRDWQMSWLASSRADVLFATGAATRFLPTLGDSQQLITVDVYNDGRGCMQAVN